jgi:hypothetical protein
MSNLKKGALLIAPAVIRAFTFFVDGLWSSVIQGLMAVLPIPTQTTVWTSMIIALVVSLALALSEKWLNGDLQFVRFGENKKQQNIGNPNDGVLF